MAPEPVMDDCISCEACGQLPWPGRTWCSNKCKDVLYSRARRSKLGPEAHPERDPMYRGALGLDGEGIDGRYTLLAASDGSYIENYAVGLSSVECFEFLLGLDPKPLKWGFAFGYDVNMMLRDFSRFHLQRLQSHGRVYWGEYSIQHFSGKLFRVTNRTTNKSVSIWDLYPFIQSSFVKFLRQFELATPEEIDRISSMKDQRSDFADVDPEEIRKYCISECRYLERGVRHFLELFSTMGYRTNAYYSPGTIAALEFRKRRIQDYYVEPPARIQDFIEKAYYGGRAECAIVGPLEGTFWQYDINSAYPYAATHVPCLAHGTWKRTTELHPYGVYHVQWNCPDGQIWGPFPWRPKTGSLKYPTEGKTHVWGIELIPCRVPFDILDGFVWEPSCDHRPLGYLQELYNQRRELKRLGDGREYVLKLILNSTYGKLAQRQAAFTNDKPRYQSLAWAGMITATTRAMLATQLTAHPEAIVMTATDSLLSSVKLDLPLGDALGQWSVKEVFNLFVVGAGFFFCEDGADLESIARTRGVRPGDIDYKELWRSWKENGRDGTYTATINRFIGYGMALQRIEGQSLWRKFWKTELQKRFSMFPRRSWRNENIYDGRTVAPGLDQVMGTQFLDELTELRRDLADSSEHDLGSLLVALASSGKRDKPTDQPDWILERIIGHD